MRVKTWEEFYEDAHSLPDVLRWATTHLRLVEEVTKHQRVLEIGTGTAMLSGLASKFCHRVVTVDTSPDVQARARVVLDQMNASVMIVRGDGFRLPFADGSFDACFSQGLLEHFTDEEAAALVSEQLRVGNVAYVSLPSAFYPHVGRWGPGLVGNERLMTLRRWRRVFAGGSVRGEYYADFKIASFAGRTLPWPAHILLEVSRGLPAARAATDAVE